MDTSNTSADHGDKDQTMATYELSHEEMLQMQELHQKLETQV